MFVRVCSKDHQSNVVSEATYQSRRVSVVREGYEKIEIELDNDLTLHIECANPDNPVQTVFLMNEDGKTIDTIFRR